MEDFLTMLFLLAPAGIANTTPIWVAKIPLLRHWQTPLDLGLKFRGQRVFGDHKTIRGVVSGLVVGGLVGWLWQTWATDSSWFAAQIEPLQGQMNFILFGALVGLFALIGDAVFSFFKRQAKIAPGRPWVPFDQIDYIVGAYLFIWFVLDLSWPLYLIGLLITPCLPRLLLFGLF